ncbi:MAG: hypothetical protein PHV11_05965 [Candidatus Bipolaricaulis sp.]|nr:hypothetical protein [Candidatus Bipolaricaulis sp.]
MIRPQANEVHVSCTFTWDKPKAERLAKAWGQFYPVKLGGPAYNDPCLDFTPGKYLKYGVTFTSRGCNNHCPWCLAWKREGKLRQIDGFAEGNIIQDNNFLQCNKSHTDKVFQMLRKQKQIQFSGGLDARLLKWGDVEQLRSLSIYQLFLACDTKGSIYSLRNVGELLKGLDRRKLRCYVLLAFNGQTISEATEHLENVWAAGFMPFAQLYQPPNERISYSKEWRDLARTWSRPAAMMSLHKET